MTRLLITGGSGYLGKRLVSQAQAEFETSYIYYRNHPQTDTRGRQLNILDARAVDRLLQEWRPQVIVHTAGSNRVPQMHEVIVEGTRNITQAAKAIGARLIHLSTDVVFDGRRGNYDETQQPTPLHAYGRAKAEAEEIVERHDNHVIVRTSLIYGLQEMDHGTAWMASALKAGQPITLFSDQLRNPVWVSTLSAACLELARLPFVGILNVAGKQVISRADFALRMLDFWRVDQRHLVQIGASDGDRWPLDCTLDLDLAQTILDTPLPGIEEVLHQHRSPGPS